MRAERERRATSATAKRSTQATTPGYEEIAGRAYELYLQRGAEDGYDLDDWLRAEHELAREQAEATAPRPKLSKPEAA